MATKRKRNKLLRLPVRYVDGHWEFYFGGEVPVEEGTFAELRVHPVRIRDPEFLEHVTQSAKVCVARPGTNLLIAINDRVGCGSGRQLRKRDEPDDAVSVDVDLEFIPFDAPSFVPVTVGAGKPSSGNQITEPSQGGFWLCLQGTSTAELVSGSIQLPSEFSDTADQTQGASTAVSLNHAYTMLSERLETHRISHTGNVYTKVFYRESNGRCYPLEILRTKTIIGAELDIQRAAWTHLERQLGWQVPASFGIKRLDRFKRGGAD